MKERTIGEILEIIEANRRFLRTYSNEVHFEVSIYEGGTFILIHTKIKKETPTRTNRIKRLFGAESVQFTLGDSEKASFWAVKFNSTPDKKTLFERR